VGREGSSELVNNPDCLVWPHSDRHWRVRERRVLWWGADTESCRFTRGGESSKKKKNNGSGGKEDMKKPKGKGKHEAMTGPRATVQAEKGWGE